MTPCGYNELLPRAIRFVRNRPFRHKRGGRLLFLKSESGSDRGVRHGQDNQEAAGDDCRVVEAA